MESVLEAAALSQAGPAPAKPRLRGVSHLVAVFVALAAAPLLLRLTRVPRQAVRCEIYLGSLVALFGASALLHRPHWGPRMRLRLARLDFAAIFALVAGTYTAMSLGLKPTDTSLVLPMWIWAALGTVSGIAWPRAPKWVASIVYVAMGWLGLGSLPALYRNLGFGIVAWITAGGLLYSIGAGVYALRRPDPFPRVFGYHEVFHALVILAAACHFTAVVLLLARTA